MSEDRLALEINNIIDRKINNISKIMPCVVSKLNDDSVDVEVLSKMINKRTGKYLSVKMLDVPVMFPASYEDAYLRLPIKKGTTGSLYVYDLDISTLIESGNETAVDAIRTTKHNRADITFRPDFQTGKKRIAIDSDAEFRNGDMSILLHSNGTIEIRGVTKEVLAVISSALGHISNFITSVQNAVILPVALLDSLGKACTGTAGMTPGAFSTDKAAIDSDNDDIDTMKV